MSKNKITICKTVVKKDGATWLGINWPKVRKVDHDWTMERYDYPSLAADQPELPPCVLLLDRKYKALRQQYGPR